jgi:hypothetical protein
VSNFLGNDDIISYLPTFNESLLRRVDINGQVRLKSIGNAFIYDFVNYIAKTNRPIICRREEQVFSE